MKIRLFYFIISIVIFIFVVFLAISLGVQRVPSPGSYMSEKFIEMPTGRWEFKTNPIFYLTDKSYSGSSNFDYTFEHPLIFIYWYFLGLVTTLILYKIRVHRFFKL